MCGSNGGDGGPPACGDGAVCNDLGTGDGFVCFCDTAFFGAAVSNGSWFLLSAITQLINHRAITY